MRHRIRTVSGVLGGALAGTLVASMLVMTPGAAAAAVRPSASSGLPPTLTEIPPGSGSHGYPYDAVPTAASFPGAPTINPASYGYVEPGFRMPGTTNIHPQSRS